jgi:hypothetical protein
MSSSSFLSRKELKGNSSTPDTQLTVSLGEFLGVVNLTVFLKNLQNQPRGVSICGWN